MAYFTQPVLGLVKMDNFYELTFFFGFNKRSGQKAIIRADIILISQMCGYGTATGAYPWVDDEYMNRSIWKKGVSSIEDQAAFQDILRADEMADIDNMRVWCDP